MLMPCSAFASGVLVHGKVISRTGQAIAYCSVFIKNSTIGTVCNENGRFSIRCRDLSDTLVAQAIGYAPTFFSLRNYQSGDSLEIVLSELVLTTREIVVNAEENPALKVIKKAQEYRKKNNPEIKSYQCKVYTKSVQRLGEIPKRVMGTKIDVNEMDMWIDDKSKILYLSEALSEYYVGGKGKTKEKMIASKVSGNSRAFSNNRASGAIVNLYEPSTFIASADRPFISPIAPDALNHYRYQLLGTFFEGDKMINKIKVIPKLKADATYTGYINIFENSWKIHSFHLSLGKDAQMEFIDSLLIEQQYISLGGDDMMPLQANWQFGFGVLGFKGSGLMVHSYSDYVLNPEFPEGFFDGKIVEIEKNSNEKDTLYWEKIRPTPLTMEESRDYRKRDSVVAVRSSPQYLDSLDKRSNRLEWNALLLGHEIKNSIKKQVLTIDAPLETFSFNAVNGFMVGSGATFSKETGDYSSWTIKGEYRYGFSNRTSYAWGGIERRWSGFSRQRLSLDFGKKIQQYNDSEPIPALFNTSLALLSGIHYMKLIESKFIHSSWSSKPLPGFKIELKLMAEDRSNARNYIFESPVLKNKPEYAQNFIFPGKELINPASNYTAGTKITFRFTPFTKYVSYPDHRYDVDSDWPELILTLDYREVKFIGEKRNSLLRLETGLNKSGTILRLGAYDLSLIAGRQLSGNPSFPSDFRHFNGNRLVLCNFGINDFFLLDYYSHSTGKSFLEGHFRFNFRGLFLNRIPGLRNAMLNEMIGVNYLSVTGMSPWMEYYIGIERLNLSAAWVYNATTTGIRIGVRL